MATNPILDIPIRQRQSTNVPLPFEKMYAILQDKQKRYDLADAYEREEKKKVSKLSSPIKEFNNYYTELKNKYLNDVTTLHSTFGGDKGSFQYQKRLQDIVDGYAADPNHNLIQESNENYLKWIETITKQKSENKYSPAANKFYENFKSVNDDGSFNKFLFAGVREKIDIQERLAKANLMTPEDEETTSYPSGNTIVTLTGKGKKSAKIYNNMISFLGQDGLEDYAYENGLPNAEVAKNYLKTVATASSNYHVSTKIDPNYEGFNAALNAAQFNLQRQKFAQDNNNENFNRQLAIEQLKLSKAKTSTEIAKIQAEIAALGGSVNPDGTVRVPIGSINSNMHNPDVSNMIDANGKVIGNIYNDAPWYKTFIQETFPDLATQENPAVDNKTAEAQEILEAQERNARFINSKGGGPKLDLNQVRKRYRNNVKVNTVINAFKEPKDADNILTTIIQQSPTYDFWQVNGETAKKLGETEKNNIRAAIMAKQSSAGSAAGFVHGFFPAFNTFGPEAISMDLVGEEIKDVGKNPQIVVARSPEVANQLDALALQEYRLAQGYAKGIPVKLERYINPETKEVVSKSPVEIFWKNFDDPISSRVVKIITKK